MNFTGAVIEIARNNFSLSKNKTEYKKKELFDKKVY